MEKVFEIMNEKNLHYLIVGFIFSIFSIARFNMIISIYIWPFCFLTYLHKNESKVIPLVIVSLCLVVSSVIRWIGCSHVNFLADLVLGIYLSLINIIPFVIDDIFYNKISKWKSVLIFPLSVAFIEFAFSFWPFANNNVYAYAHRENIQYLQIISVFGCYFLSFIIALFSSILDYSLDLYKNENRISKFIFIYCTIIIIIYFFGLIRLLIPIEKGSINIAASIGVSQSLYENKDESGGVLNISFYIDYMNETMKRASDSKAQIMTYAEEAFFIFLEDKQTIIDSASEFARNYSIFALIALDVYHNETYSSNEAVLISDEGEVLYNYQKQHLIPLVEKGYYEDMKELKSIDTKYGKLTVVICYDINFPFFLNSLSRDHFDLLLVPSWDWDGIAEWHSNEVRYRAIEGGFNVLKNTANGIIISSDYKGRSLSYHITQDFEDYHVISNVNNKGVKTIYSYIGSFFNFLYLIALIFIIIFDKIKGCLNKENKENKENESSSSMKMLSEMSAGNREYEDD